MDTDRNVKPDLTNESSSEEGPGGMEEGRRNIAEFQAHTALTEFMVGGL